MKKFLLMAVLCAFYSAGHAQTSNKAITEKNPEIKAKDEKIKTELIGPAQKAALPGEPDWEAIAKTITAKYDAVTADRTVTKAKIYYYYNKDWPLFCAGIVHYTNNWELADDYALLNLNAGMILQYSKAQAELKEALRWAKAAAAGNPANEKYQVTYNAIKEQIK